MVRIKPTKTVNLPEGEYKAYIFHMEMREGKWGPTFTTSFTIKAGEYKNTEVTSIIPGKLTSGNLFGKLILAVTGSFDENKEYETDDLEFKPVTLVVQPKEVKGKVYGRIVDFKPWDGKLE